MDCEKFESLLIDELYGELDEVTSAAVRRHAAGCARCGALLSGLRATRKVAALPVEEPASDLEDRILSAVREQQKVLPFRARMSSAVSRAGAWAMRPQTAMAAVFLVVIGTSFVLVQSRKQLVTASSNAEGAPAQAGFRAGAAATVAASAYAFDQRESAFAHGVEEKRAEVPRTITVTPAPEASIADGDRERDKAKDELAKNDLSANAAPVAGLDTTAARGAVANNGWTGQGQGPGAVGGGSVANPTVQSQAPYASGGASFGTAKQLYDHGRYDDAKAQWNTLAPTDPNAALWAARAEKAKNGCGTAVAQFEALRGRAPVANEATLEAARCYRAIGNSDSARSRYGSLMTTPLAQTAQTELDAMTPAAAAHKSAPARMEAQAAQPRATATATPTTPKAVDKKASSADGL